MFEKTDRYIRLLKELGLKLVKVVDFPSMPTISAMGAPNRTNCVTVMGEQSPVDVVSMRVSDGERVTIGGIDLTAMHAPGHTDDGYCFHGRPGIHRRHASDPRHRQAVRTVMPASKPIRYSGVLKLLALVYQI